MKASLGISMLPNFLIFFLPSAWRFSSFIFLEISPPYWNKVRMRCMNLYHHASAASSSWRYLHCTETKTRWGAWTYIIMLQQLHLPGDISTVLKQREDEVHELIPSHFSSFIFGNISDILKHNEMIHDAWIWHIALHLNPSTWPFWRCPPPSHFLSLSLSLSLFSISFRLFPFCSLW